MQDLHSDCLRQVLEELLCVGAAVFNSWEKKSVGGSVSVFPFCYDCVLELCLLVVRLCDRMAEEGSGKVGGWVSGRARAGGCCSVVFFL